MKRVLLIFFCLSFLTGCATLIARTPLREMGDADFPRSYPATYMDSMGLVDSFRPNGPYKGAFEWPLRIGSAILLLVDFPISIVTDTICLPLDILLYEPRDLGNPSNQD